MTEFHKAEFERKGEDTGAALRTTDDLRNDMVDLSRRLGAVESFKDSMAEADLRKRVRDLEKAKDETAGALRVIYALAGLGLAGLVLQALGYHLAR